MEKSNEKAFFWKKSDENLWHGKIFLQYFQIF
jgi:hypothetical protein